VFQNELCFMSDKHRTMYDKFKELAYLGLDKFLLDGTTPGVGFIRARQLQEHPNVFPDLTAPGEYVDILPKELPDKLERMLVHFSDFERTGKPFVVYTPLVPQIRQLTDLAHKMGLKVAAMHGGVSARDRGKLDTAFKAGELQGLICNPQVASVGFNWGVSGDREVEHFFFVTCDFLDTTILQAYRRGIRGKRKTPLLVTVMEYDDSTDQRVFAIIRRKSREANKADSTRPVLCLGQQDRSRPVLDFSPCQPEATS
jgi:SNF2 family DNA or RNA helicase